MSKLDKIQTRCLNVFSKEVPFLLGGKFLFRSQVCKAAETTPSITPAIAFSRFLFSCLSPSKFLSY